MCKANKFVIFRKALALVLAFLIALTGVLAFGDPVRVSASNDNIIDDFGAREEISPLWHANSYPVLPKVELFVKKSLGLISAYEGLSVPISDYKYFYLFEEFDRRRNVTVYYLYALRVPLVVYTNIVTGTSSYPANNNTLPILAFGSIPDLYNNSTSPLGLYTSISDNDVLISVGVSHDFSYRFVSFKGGSYRPFYSVGESSLDFNYDKLLACSSPVLLKYKYPSVSIDRGIFKQAFPSLFTGGITENNSVNIGGDVVTAPEPFIYADLKKLPFYDDIKDYIEKNAGTVFGIMLKPFEGVIDGLNLIYTLIQMQLNVLESFRARLFDKLEDIFGRYWNIWLATYAANMLNIINTIKEVSGNLAHGDPLGAIGSLFSGTGEFFTNLFTGFRGIFAQWLTDLKAFWDFLVENKIPQAILKSLLDFFERYKAWYLETFDKFIHPVDTLADMFPIIQSMIDWQKSFYIKLGDMIKDIFKFLYVPQKDYLNIIKVALDERVPVVSEFHELSTFISNRFLVQSGTAPTISIPLSNIQSPSFRGMKDIVIDFSWFAPYRVAVHGFISAFLIGWFIVSQFFGLKSLFNATASGADMAYHIERG